MCNVLTKDVTCYHKTIMTVSTRKRKYRTCTPDEVVNPDAISLEFSQNCLRELTKDPVHAIVRNAIVTIGSELATTNQDELNKITHLFMNTVKKKNLKATCQGGSGRCWMFAGLNTMRHIMIKGMDLDNFEFSQTYLFFWDKFERSNTYLQWFIDNPDAVQGDRHFDFITSMQLSDGGWWNTFVNLVDKYGVVPKTAMEETYQSEDTEDMNQTLMLYLNSAVCQLRRKEVQDIKTFKTKTMTRIFSILVKYLGTPPNTFDWTFTQDDEVKVMQQLNPTIFKDMLTSSLSMSDFVVLTDLPQLRRNTLYTLRYSSNIIGGKDLTILNLSIESMAKYTKKSILTGLSVWFAADVSKHFNYWHSTLNDKINDSTPAFGPLSEMSKKEQLVMCNTEPNHAMAFTGVNVDDKGKLPVSWQVENSWGFHDHETAGMDGFLCMSHSWFNKYVIQVSIFKQLLSKVDQQLLETRPVPLLPWELGGSALRIVGKAAPTNYLESLRNTKRR